MGIIEALQRSGLRDIRERPFEGHLQSFGGFKECLERGKKAFPGLKVSIAVSAEGDGQAEPCTLIFRQQDVIRWHDLDLEGCGATIGPLYLEVKAEHPVDP